MSLWPKISIFVVASRASSCIWMMVFCICYPSPSNCLHSTYMCFILYIFSSGWTFDPNIPYEGRAGFCWLGFGIFFMIMMQKKKKEKNGEKQKLDSSIFLHEVIMTQDKSERLSLQAWHPNNEIPMNCFFPLYFCQSFNHSVPSLVSCFSKRIYPCYLAGKFYLWMVVFIIFRQFYGYQHGDCFIIQTRTVKPPVQKA